MDHAASSGILYTDPEISAPAIHLVRIHPLVIFQMADAYQRAVFGKGRTKEDGTRTRGDDDDKEETDAIGVLFGECVKSEALVLDCYPCVPRKSTMVDNKLNTQMFQEHRNLFPNEQVLGYFAFSEQRREWPGILGEERSGIHIWMRPTLPPMLDVFWVLKPKGEDRLIASPVEYVIDAGPEEQLGLSRLADQQSKGSLQAAVNELISLFNQMRVVCGKKQATKDKLFGRSIFVALQQTHLKPGEENVLAQAKQDIQRFISQLDEADDLARVWEERLSNHSE
jgi:hypothetical protein